MIARPEGSRLRRTRMASVAVLAAGALAVAGCGGDDSDGSSGTGATGADAGVAGFVPAGSPMYYEVTTDLDSPQWDTVRALGGQFPAYPELLERLDDELADEGIDFESDLRPLLGERAAVALTSIDDVAAVTELEGDGDRDDATEALQQSGGFLGVLDIADGVRPDVEALIVRTGGTADGEHGGASLFTSPDAPSDTTAIAVGDDVLMIADTRVELVAAIDAASAGGEATLAGSTTFTDTIGKLPQDVFGRAYIDVGELTRAGGEAFGDDIPGGLLSGVEDGVVGAGVIAEPDGVRVKGVTSGVEATRNFTSFTPSLVASVPADALFFSEVANISDVIRGEIEAIRAETDPELLEQVDAFATTVPEFLGVTLDQIAALGEGQQALVVLPAVATADAPASETLPGVVFMSRVADPAGATATLDAIRTATPSLIAAIGGFTGMGQPGPVADLDWRPVELAGGVQGWRLAIAEDLGVVYAVRDDLVLIGSSADALSAVLAPSAPLSESSDYAEATQGIPDSVTGVSWLDLEGIIALGEEYGVFEDAPEDTLPNLRPLRSIAYWDTGGDEPTFEMFLRIGD